MIDYLIFSLLMISVVSVIFINENKLKIENAVFWTRIALTVAGVSSTLIGFLIYSSNSELGAFFGAFICVIGVQTTLWVLGIKLGALGNRELSPSDYNERIWLELPVDRSYKSIHTTDRLPDRLREIYEMIESADISLSKDNLLDKKDHWTEDLISMSLSIPFTPQTYTIINTIVTLREQIKLRFRISGENNIQLRNELADALAKLKVHIYLRLIEVC
jgi:hypothetical protein